jgi:hypothetical protein
VRPSSVSDDGQFVDRRAGRARPREYGAEPAPGSAACITFGDSFTFGDEVPAESRSSGCSSSAGRRSRCSTSASAATAPTRRSCATSASAGLGAEVACLGILLENIGRNVNRYRPLWNTRTGICVTKPRFVLDARGELELVPQPFGSRAELRAAILDGSVFGRIAEHEHWLGRASSPASCRRSARIVAGYFAYRARSPARLWSDPDGEPFRVTVAILEAFHRRALEPTARAWPRSSCSPRARISGATASPAGPTGGPSSPSWNAGGSPYVDLVTPIVEAARRATRHTALRDAVLSAATCRSPGTRSWPRSCRAGSRARLPLKRQRIECAVPWVERRHGAPGAARDAPR